MIPFKQARGVTLAQVEQSKPTHTRWDKHYAWYLSEFWDDQVDNSVAGSGSSDGDIKLETNYPYAFVDTMVANICPTNPLLTINARKKDLKEAARNREFLINDTMRRDRIHAKSWDISTYAAICGWGISKTVWSKKKRHPTTLVVDPRNVFWDRSTPEWENIRYIVEATILTQEEFQKRVDSKLYNPAVARHASPGAFPEWMMDTARNKSYTNDASINAFKWIVVYEFYDLTADRFMHFTEEGDGPLYEGPLPYKYMRNPFSLVIFNKNLKDNTGISDIKLIERIQERLNEIDSLELWYAHQSIPVPILNDALLDDPEAAETSFANATGPGQIIRLKLANDTMSIQNAVGFLQSPTTLPSFQNMRERCTSLIEFILGLPQYQRGSYGGAQVATELALTDTATKTRNGRRIRVLEDWIVDIGSKGLALWKELLDPTVELSLRSGGVTSETVDVDRVALAFPETTPEMTLAPEQFDDEWAYDFEAVPYSPTENHKLVQMQKLAQFLPVLAQSQMVDQRALVAKLLELMGIEEILSDQPVQGQTPGVPAQAQGGASNMSGTSADAIPSGGAAPQYQEQMEAILPAGTRSMADQPKVG